jgi:hypothetical protein
LVDHSQAHVLRQVRSSLCSCSFYCVSNGTGANWSIVQTGILGYGGIAVGDVNTDGAIDAGYGMHW